MPKNPTKTRKKVRSGNFDHRLITNGKGNGKSASRLSILKTYKIFIGGKFPRTESGRYFQIKDGSGSVIANVCRSSRKDFRDAVVAARIAFKSWSSKSAYTRGQIIYRIAEMLEARKAQFEEEMVSQGYAPKKAKAEVSLAVDRLVYYAGWTDKYQQIFSSVNPVSSSHFNFSICEPTGVVAVLAPQDTALNGLISTVIPAIAGGNTCIALASEKWPLSSISWAEVLQSSDLPGGVINLLTGYQSELASQFTQHMDVNAIIYCEQDRQTLEDIQRGSTSNLKRVLNYGSINWQVNAAQNPYLILDTQEIKTTWHPIGI